MKSRTLLREMQKGLATLENSFFKKREKKRRKKQRKKRKEKEKTASTLPSTSALGFLS